MTIIIYDWQKVPDHPRDLHQMQNEELTSVAECFNIYNITGKPEFDEVYYRCVIRPENMFAEVHDFADQESALMKGRERFIELGYKIVSPGLHNMK